jgi:hypothetical protein
MSIAGVNSPIAFLLGVEQLIPDYLAYFIGSPNQGGECYHSSSDSDSLSTSEEADETGNTTDYS